MPCFGSLAEELRSPSKGKFLGWLAKKIMASGNGEDSIDAVSMVKTQETGNVIVELGPGGGFALCEMIESLKPKRVYAVEISESFRMGLKANSKLESAFKDGVLSIHDDDALNLPFIEKNSVDLVFAFNVIYFLDPLIDYMKEMNRIVKPGGQICFCVKDMAKNFDPNVYVNTDWEKCMEAMKKGGFVDVKRSEERLEKGLAYSALLGKKPL